MASAATPNFVRSQRILIASGDSSFRRHFMENGHSAEVSEEAFGGAHALSRLAQNRYDSVLLDRNLPDLDSSEVADIIRKCYPQMEVELVDSQSEWKEKNGGFTEPAGNTATLRLPLPTVVAPRPKSTERIEQIFEGLPGMIGSSRAIQQVYRLVRMVSKRDTTVLITGETGTGKELVANAVHQLSSRANQPFVVVNCAAIPEALLEAELFGHARGAFTGAVQSRLGRIHVAQGGTLFLDEIGELPLSMQAKLLRFLQNGEVQRLGSSDVYKVDVRVVCATNVRLFELVQAKRFRMDLYYRLAVFPINLPPLRERREDIAELAKHFLDVVLKEASLPSKEMSEAVLAMLEQLPWAGNVRELQHAIERACILAAVDEEIAEEHFQGFPDEAQMIEL
jgi:transcriptional regulator with GAF, ATPase, and Fis domain/CheY-like chemotaxis protein